MTEQITQDPTLTLGSQPVQPTDLTEFTPNVTSIAHSTKRLSEGNILPVATDMAYGETRAYMVVDVAPSVQSVVEAFRHEDVAAQEGAFAAHPELTSQIPPKLLATLFAFNKALWSQGFSDNPQRSQIRHDYYKSGHAKGIQPILEQGAAKCAELSVVAQMALQEIGVKSKYVAGSRLSAAHVDSSDRFPDLHAFLIVPDLETEGSQVSYVYDPYNTMKIPGPDGTTHYAPLLFRYEDEDADNLFQNDGQPQMVQGKAVLSRQNDLYGYADGGHLLDKDMALLNSQ